MAERVGFEPTVRCRTTVFKTVTFNRSDTSPLKIILSDIHDFVKPLKDLFTEINFVVNCNIKSDI